MQMLPAPLGIPADPLVTVGQLQGRRGESKSAKPTVL
jgi:hypothetical protein